MTHSDIVAQLAKERVIETIISNIGTDTKDDTYQDLAQDLYECLLRKDPDTLVQMYLNNEIRYYLVRMVVLNVCSKNSPYYYDYKLPQKKAQYYLDDPETTTTVQNIEDRP